MHFLVKNRDFFGVEKKFPRTPQAGYRQGIFFCTGWKIGSSGFCHAVQNFRIFPFFSKMHFRVFPFPTTHFFDPKIDTLFSEFPKFYKIPYD